MRELRLLLPSEGALAEGALDFLKKHGFTITKEKTRKYLGKIDQIDIDVLFQRSSDITGGVEFGSGDLGIVGLDRYYEYRKNSESTKVIIEDLGFGEAKLVLACPNSWLDLSFLSDLSDVAIQLRNKGMDLRIATKYPKLVRNFLKQAGVNYFVLVSASGGLEAAPLLGYADMIADITVTGTTIRDNDLKIIKDGIVFESQACLIAKDRIVPNHIHIPYKDQGEFPGILEKFYKFSWKGMRVD